MENRRFIWLIVFMICLSFFAFGRSQEIKYGNLSSLISQIRNYMPSSNSYAFVVPTIAQMDSFRTMTQYVIQQDYWMADSFAQNLGYALFEWYDTAFDSTLYYVLMEPNANTSGGVEVGWGTFIFYPQGSEKVIIEVPHPYFDSNTWRVGFAIYQSLSNRFFLMAGTHRYANGTNPRPADVAHNTQNMFHVVHEEVSPYSQHALQVHGFSRSNHPGYPDVILSNGTPNPSLILDSLAQEIITEGYTVGIFDGINYTSLGATTNNQGQFSNANGYSFIHMELEYFIRASTSQWENIVSALYRLFYVPSAIQVPPGLSLPENLILYSTYPNPFNSQINVEYKIQRSSQVLITVYNSLGQRIRLLEERFQGAGQYRIVWDGRNDSGEPVPSGLYWLILQAGKENHLRKVTLIK